MIYPDASGSAVTVDEMLQRTWTDGFLVMHGGEIVLEQYFNGMTPQTLHLMMSYSKSVTSTLVGIAAFAGQMDPSAALTDYLPELTDTALNGATLQQALDMQVGVTFDEDYENLNGDWRDFELATGWRDAGPGYTGPRDIAGVTRTLTDSSGPHGDVFHYQSVVTNIVGVCLERATGRRFSDLLSEQTWQPLGAEQDLVTIVDSTGSASFEGGFNCCLRDFSRFGRLICECGNVEGRQVVPSEWTDVCRFPESALVASFARSEYGDALRGFAYHNKWWVRDPARGVIMALGINGQMLYIDPERDFVAAKFSSQPEAVDFAMALDQIDGIEAILDACLA